MHYILQIVRVWSRCAAHEPDIEYQYGQTRIVHSRRRHRESKYIKLLTYYMKFGSKQC